MNIIICDDRREDRDNVSSLAKQYFREVNCPVNIAVYESGEALLENSGILEPGNVKVAFLDIYMPGLSGIEIAGKIREKDTDMVIVFTTTSLDHGLDAYAVQALQYLVKPVKYPELENILSKCVKLFADSLRFVEVLSDRMTVRVLLKDILYLEILNHTCLIHTLSETIKSYRPLSEIECQLDRESFLRTHRSYIVNMRYIEDVTENDFLLTTGQSAPIRRSDRLAVKQAYRDYLFSIAREL